LLSWILEAFLSSIPAWLWLVGGGVGLGIYFASGILSHVPAFGNYARLLKPLAGIVALVCVFMYGGAGVQAMWEAKILAAQEEAKIAEAKAEQLNKDLSVARQKKTEVRVEYRDRVKTEIREVATTIDAKCDVDSLAVEKLNKAATNPHGASK
jgi:hypothetical protein